MTDSEPKNDNPDTETVPSSEEITQSLRLRPERPRVTRISRKILVGGVAVVAILVSAAAFWALQNNRAPSSKPEDTHSTEHRNVADGLATLPMDYSGVPRDVPRLGPPLPGDLGRPIVAAQTQTSPIAVDAEQQRANQEAEAARTSKVFASINVRQQPVQSSSSEGSAAAGSSPDDVFVQNGQDRKLAFVNAPVDRRTTSPDRLARPASPYVLQAGAVIPAALITGIRSDLPGQITAQVTERVYDSPTGRSLLIPQGAILIGLYDSQIAFGQKRVLLVWTRLIMPNGRSIVLERQAGADASGFAGLEDEVDNHWGELFRAALLSTVLSVGTQLGSSGTEDDIVRALRRGGSDSLNQTGQQVVRRNLNIQPTLTIRSGFPVRVIVNRDLVLQPYKQ